MRILFVNDSLVGGGKERRFVQLVKGLNERGFDDLHLISFTDVNDYPVIHSYKINLHVVKRLIKWDPVMFYKLFKLIKKINPDIIHTWSIMTSFYISIICRIINKPHISAFIANATGLKKFSIESIAILFPYVFADVILGNSSAGLNAFKAPVNKSKVIYNGFDMDRLKVKADKTALMQELNIVTRYIVVMAARFDQAKDFNTFFLAANQLINSRNDITFLAIGKGNLFDEYAKRMENKNEKYIRMLGFRHDIDAIIKMSDIGVLCTNPIYHEEGISNSLMEFMAFGKPVIATAGGGTNELISDNETGFIIDPQNPDELAHKINSLLNNPALSTTIGQNAKMFIQESFSLEKMTEVYIELYCQNLKLRPSKLN